MSHQTIWEKTGIIWHFTGVVGLDEMNEANREAHEAMSST